MTVPANDSVPIQVPDLCARHLNELVVRRLKLRDTDPWRSRVVIAQMLLFQWTATDPRFWQRCGRTADEHDEGTMNLVLAEVGCLACWSPRGFRVVWTMMRDDMDGAVAASQRGDWAVAHFPKKDGDS